MGRRRPLLEDGEGNPVLFMHYIVMRALEESFIERSTLSGMAFEDAEFKSNGVNLHYQEISTEFTLCPSLEYN